MEPTVTESTVTFQEPSMSDKVAGYGTHEIQICQGNLGVEEAGEIGIFHDHAQMVSVALPHFMVIWDQGYPQNATVFTSNDATLAYSLQLKDCRIS